MPFFDDSRRRLEILNYTLSRDHIIEEIKIKQPQKLLKADEIISKASLVPITDYNFSGYMQRISHGDHLTSAQPLWLKATEIAVEK